MQGAPESNGDWSNYKPHGELSMTVTNPVAIEQFEIGGVYRLTFERPVRAVKESPGRPYNARLPGWCRKSLVSKRTERAIISQGQL